MRPLQATLSHLSLAALILVLTGCHSWVAPIPEYQPSMAQEGKDVIWMPTSSGLADQMLKAAHVTPDDLVYDLGAGDGKIAILAAKQFKATAVGIEFNPDMAEYARKNAQRAGVSDKVTIVTGDIFKEDFSKATVVTLYLLPALNIKLRPTILSMKPGTRIVSNTFTMGDWTADQTVQDNVGHTGYLWIVPAHVEGLWSIKGLPDLGDGDAMLNVKQRYQHIEARLQTQRDGITPLTGKMVGNTMRFEYIDHMGKRRLVMAEIEGNRLKGTVSGSPDITLSGNRVSK